MAGEVRYLYSMTIFQGSSMFRSYRFFSCTLLFRPLVLICLTLHYLILYFNDNSRVYQVNPACKKHRVFANLGPSRWQFISLRHIKCILCKKIWFVSCLVGFISCSVRVIYLTRLGLHSSHDYNFSPLFLPPLTICRQKLNWKS